MDQPTSIRYRMVSLVVNVEQLNADAALSRWDREPFITERYRAASTKDACLKLTEDR